MWKVSNGSIPKGLLVLHQCDNPTCVNPKHLFLGTHQDNTNDMYSKERGPCNPAKGEKHWQAKLTNSQVLKIRRLYMQGGVSYSQLASRYGVVKQTIHRVVKRKLWSHVKGHK